LSFPSIDLGDNRTAYGAIRKTNAYARNPGCSGQARMCVTIDGELPVGNLSEYATFMV
jgi:hypothetical protein